MPHELTQTEWNEQMSVKILRFIHSELYLDLRFLDIAFSSLIPAADPKLQTTATDGVYFKYNPEKILRLFQDNPKFLNRAFLHSVLHCIFSHLWLAGRRESYLWNISCDILVEYTIDTMDKPCTRRILTWTRQKVYESFAADKQGISAPIIYQKIKNLPPEHLSILQSEFYTDDHAYWPIQKEQPAAYLQSKSNWDKIARQTSMQRHLSGNDSGRAGQQLLQAQLKASRSQRSYRDFLNKFSVLQEELHCDPDEFDLNFYTYGLKIYGNMPLVEPLETKEFRKIREFIIVLDTSDSTSGNLIQNFLQETFQILHQKDHFFSKCKIRILQCDNEVRMDQEITDIQQFEHLLHRFQLAGGGGTDFRPAFQYVEQLIAEGTFKNLGGLLYFTDGYGIYPKKKPSYPTAFLFLNEFNEEAVPPWAMRLKLEPEEFLENKKEKNETERKMV